MRLTGQAVAMPQELLKESSIQEFPLFAKAVDPNNGDCYRYVKAGAVALVPGKLQDAPLVVGNHSNISVYAAAAIGATSVTVTLGATAATANQYAGGQMVVNDATGEGYTYKIASHPAANSAATLVLTLEDPLKVALDTTSQVTLCANPGNGVLLHASTEVSYPVGVAIYPITASYFGWIKTRGAVAALQDSSTTTVGLGCAASGTTDGAVTASNGVLANVGYYLVGGVSTEYNPIYLMMD